MHLDLEDWLGLLGLLLLGSALGWLFGWAGLIGYAGAILVTVAMKLAEKRTDGTKVD